MAGERNGRWGQAIQVPGLAALNTGGYAETTSVSCGAAGSCAAGGYYNDGQEGFVASERNGRWGKAIQVPGRPAAETVTSVSCASPGNCAAGGWYGFVTDERNGRWGKAIKVPGLSAFNKGLDEVNSVSCASPGNCAAGGDYSGHGSGAFVAAERNGRWGTAIQVPGLSSPRQAASLTSVSCASAGNCAAGGYYFDRTDNLQVFVVVERNGRWGKATRVPGLAALNKGRETYTEASYFPTVSCTPPGACTAGGAYTDASGHAQGFITQAR